jgi:hydroxypyruvate isomerase
MIPIGVCLEAVFTDLPVEERLKKIAAAGYQNVEFWHPEGTWNGSDIDFGMPKDPASLKQACEEHGIAINDFAFHAWEGSIGGCPVRSEDHGRFFEQIAKMCDFAKAVGCSKGIILSGIVDDSLSRDQMKENMVAAFSKAADIAAESGITLLIEALNTHVDHGGYYLDTTAEAAEVARAVGKPNIKILFDVYHMQIMHGNLIATIEQNIDVIGHFHAAGVPGRAELFDTEVNYPAIMKKIGELEYDGCFGLEYFPQMADHTESLKKIKQYLKS